MSILDMYYTISHNWERKRYLGLDLDWDYNKCCVHLSMLNYGFRCPEALHHL